MTDREKLIELLWRAHHNASCVMTYDGDEDAALEEEARYLIANGVTVQKHGRWERGAIISGYQGIGKSTLANVDSGYIDLESGNFFVDGKRAEDWYIPYCQIATHLAEQGYRVFVSSHAVVREHLASMPKSVDLYVCFPSYSLRRQWEAKLEARYNASQKDKDFRAWKNAEDRYAENIKELHEAAGFIPIVIHDMSYDLGRLLDLNCGAKMDGEV